jgi:hypothetical protein
MELVKTNNCVYREQGQFSEYSDWATGWTTEVRLPAGSVIMSATQLSVRYRGLFPRS